MGFRMTQKVLFRHCDPAGIVFFPRYFEMVNDCVEAFFDEAVGWPFEDILTDAGTPTAAIASEFLRPSRHGDVLEFDLVPQAVGRSSMRYVLTARCAEEMRFRTEATIVHVDASGRPAKWPAGIRARLLEMMEGEA